MFCAKCGKKIDEGSIFCPYCGQKVNAPVKAGKALLFGDKKKTGENVAASSNAKTGVSYLKKCLYIGIFAIFVIMLFIIIFSLKNKSRDADTMIYMPGVYTTTLILNDNKVDIEVTVDEKRIKSVRMVNVDEETVFTMFPLLQPVFEDLASQICEKQSLDDITYSDDNKYTSTVLLNAIEDSLRKAKEAAGNTEEK